MFPKILLSFFFALSAQASDIKNFHLIDHDSTGFAIFRYGAPDADGVEEMCERGIDEVMVLSGDAEEHEGKYKSKCPNLKVIYNYKQNAKVAVTTEFLNFFDRWVQDAKQNGKKIAFRCSCGCHRTGRLAAYYQMKYQHLTDYDATVLMNKHGKYMFLHPQLPGQVRALKDYILGKPCEEKEKYCVIQ